MKRHLQLNKGRLTKYQAFLLDTLEVTRKACNTLNPAPLMPTETSPNLAHCSEAVKLVYFCRADISDTPLEGTEKQFDGSSFAQNGQRKAGYAIISLYKTTEAHPLLPSTSAQKAEIIGLTQVLTLGQGKSLRTLKSNRYVCIPMVWLGYKGEKDIFFLLEALSLGK